MFKQTLLFCPINFRILQIPRRALRTLSPGDNKFSSVQHGDANPRKLIHQDFYTFEEFNEKSIVIPLIDL